jgi:hypothetical protein
LNIRPDGGKVKVYGETFAAFTGTVTGLVDATRAFCGRDCAIDDDARGIRKRPDVGIRRVAADSAVGVGFTSAAPPRHLASATPSVTAVVFE